MQPSRSELLCGETEANFHRVTFPTLTARDGSLRPVVRSDRIDDIRPLGDGRSANTSQTRYPIAKTK